MGLARAMGQAVGRPSVEGENTGKLRLAMPPELSRARVALERDAARGESHWATSDQWNHGAHYPGISAFHAVLGGV